MLSREAFLSASNPVAVDVRVPALGGAVKVREMTVAQKDAFEIENARDKGRYFRPRLVVASVVDADGSPMFGPADLEALAGRPASHLEPIVEAATKLNKYTPEDVKALEGN
ncbi:MAG TPA: hypothetical protein VGE43_13795 [Acidimicrobiales bacterium]